MTLTFHDREKFSLPPSAVFMDLDNTLYEYSPCHEEALEQVRIKAARLLAIGPSDFDALYVRARQEIKSRVGRTAASHNRLLYFQRLIELAGFKTQVLAALDLEQTYWSRFLSVARLFDDALEFLDDVRALRKPIVIVTNLTAQIQFRKIVHFGLDQYLDYVVTSEEAGADKPALAPFEVAMEKIGEVSTPVWLIGEDPDDDMGALDILPNVVGLQKLHAGVRKRVPSADATFTEFADARRLIAQYKAP
jgi:putative hydrolase of the HAD superfamily